MSSSTLDSGLQRERTTLAWTRTTLGVLVNGLLVLVRHDRDFPLRVSTALSCLCLVIAGLTLWSAFSRSRIEQLPQGRVVAAPGHILALGVLVLLLAVATTVAIARYGGAVAG